MMIVSGWAVLTLPPVGVTVSHGVVAEASIAAVKFRKPVPAFETVRWTRAEGPLMTKEKVMGSESTLMAALPPLCTLTMTGICTWAGLAVGALTVTVPVKVPGGRADGSTVTAMEVGAEPDVELMLSQLSAEAVFIVDEAV